MQSMTHEPIRHDWTCAEVEALFALPFNDCVRGASACTAAISIRNRCSSRTLLSIKTGGCPEDCAYCPQSAHYDTGLAPRS